MKKKIINVNPNIFVSDLSITLNLKAKTSPKSLTQAYQLMVGIMPYGLVHFNFFYRKKCSILCLGMMRCYPTAIHTLCQFYIIYNCLS